MDTAESFLKTLFHLIYGILSTCWLLLALFCLNLPYPLNLMVALAPLYAVFIAWAKQMLRFIRLGFVHDRIREISQEEMDEAMRELAKNRKL